MRGLSLFRDEETRSINAENPEGRKGFGGQAVSPLGKGRKGRPNITLPRGETVTLADITEGPGEIRHIWMTVTDQTENYPFVLRNLILRMYWDNEEKPSVEVPLGDFFCNGFAVKTPVYSEPVSVIPHGGFNCYFPMPFKKRAKITIENQHQERITDFFFQIDYALVGEAVPDSLYFHAQWRRQPVTELKKDYAILDGVRGKGHLAGIYLGIAPLERNWYGEGEVKFFIDGDDEFPTICGTGVEDYFGGAWGFVENPGETEQTYHSPYLGHPYLNNPGNCRGNGFDDVFVPMRSFYRWHIPDPVCFKEDIRITVQQIGLTGNGLYERQDDYCSTAYWYQSEPHTDFPPLPDREGRRPR